MKFDFDDGNITFCLSGIFEAMTEEQQDAFIHQFSLQKNIIEKVCDYLAGDDTHGSWSSYDDEYRIRALKRIQNRQLTNWSPYNWDFFSEARNRLKEIREKQHIYWALNHGPFREELWNSWMKFCKANNIVSEYTTKQADEDVARVEKIVRDALAKLVDEDTP
jgi:hypothetical protein